MGKPQGQAEGVLGGNAADLREKSLRKTGENERKNKNSWRVHPPKKTQKKKGKYIVFTDPENADWRQGMGKDMKK